MVLEFLGMAIILVVWSLEMNEKLKKKDIDNQHYKFIVLYIIGFLVLSYYFSQTNNLVFAFFFGLMTLISLIEFAFVMIKSS